MSTEKRLYRSRDALLGGVCAGVAEYFNIDPVVVRILVIVFTLLTAGLLVVPYLVLWVMLPTSPQKADPVDVQPQSVHSDTYGQITFEIPQNKADSAVYEAARQAARNQTSSVPFVGAGHTPPEPPPCTGAWASTRQPYVQSAAWQAPGWGAPSLNQNDWVGPACAPPGGVDSPEASQPPPSPMPDIFAQQPGSSPVYPYVSAPVSTGSPRQGARGVTAAVWVGALVLSFGVAAFLTQFIHNIAWWQFWPLIPATVGIALMVVPGKPGQRMAHFVNGLMLFAVGGAFLPMSLELISWDTVGVALANFWPLLVIMVGFFIISSATHSAWLRLVAGLCFVLFCLAGMGVAVPGAVDSIVLELPFDRELSFPFQVIVLR